MRTKKEEYVPLADAVLIRLATDQPDFEAANHLYNTAYVAAMQAKTDEVRQKEAADVLLIEQKAVTKSLYLWSDDLNMPIKLFSIVLTKAAIETPLCSEVLKLIKKRNAEGLLTKIKAIQDVIAAHTNALTANGMKPDLPNFLQTAHTEITAKSNLQTDLIKQRKAYTNANKVVYKELYNYVGEVCKIGKIIYQGTQKAEEYTIDKMIQKMHATGGVKK
jgi:hypothetical protein